LFINGGGIAMTGPQVGDRISEYVLDALIGAGSFGQVWKAHHHVWKDEFVAIKVPTDSQYVRNLQKEACTIHGLRHANIVRAIGLDPYAETPYLVMEFVDGQSLAALVAANRQGMPIRSVEHILRGMLSALECAHAGGVIHRDIKPANVLIAGAGKRPIEQIRAEDVKVADFGLGRAGELTANSILQSGSLLAEDGKSISGTLAYMAPEQRDGGQTDARSDLYSVGIVLFEMICGERPSGSDLPSSLREGLPAWIDGVYTRLHTRHDRRFASATDVLLAMQPAATASPVSSRVGVPPLPGPKLASRTTGRSECPSCGYVGEAGDNFCIMCGEKRCDRVRRCPTCGAYPAAEDLYCILCGAALAAAMG
jgi:serine/threonine protein kinase